MCEDIQERFRVEWQKMIVDEVRGVGEECEVLRENIAASCERSVWHVENGNVRKGSEWWDNEDKFLVKEKRDVCMIIGKCTRESSRSSKRGQMRGRVSEYQQTS